MTVCGVLKGTCVPDCSTYGVCHCGCGRATNVAPANRPMDGHVISRRFAYVYGHTPTARYWKGPAIPFAPLAGFIKADGRKFTDFGPAPARRLDRWKAQGTVPFFSADEFIVHQLHTHPAVVYGLDWFDDDPGPAS